LKAKIGWRQCLEVKSRKWKTPSSNSIPQKNKTKKKPRNRKFDLCSIANSRNTGNE
jgi:hypothetical protein